MNTRPTPTSDTLQLSLRHRYWTYGICAVLFLSGAIWQILRWLPDSSRAHAESTPWLMRVHGAAAMGMLLLLGTLIPIHLRRGWIAGRNRISGFVLASVFGVLIVTGYFLYYAGGETVRAWASNLHLTLGFAGPLIILLHIWLGRKSRTRS